MSAEVKEMLILSTAHLSEQTAKFLAASDCIDWPALGGPVGGRGWFFEVQADEPPEGVNDYFSDLFGAFRFAAAKAYRAIRFFDDTQPREDLPAYRAQTAMRFVSIGFETGKFENYAALWASNSAD
jgi:hypothetical protein